MTGGINQDVETKSTLLDGDEELPALRTLEYGWSTARGCVPACWKVIFQCAQPPQGLKGSKLSPMLQPHVPRCRNTRLRRPFGSFPLDKKLRFHLRFR